MAILSKGVVDVDVDVGGVVGVESEMREMGES